MNILVNLFTFIIFHFISRYTINRQYMKHANQQRNGQSNFDLKKKNIYIYIYVLSMYMNFLVLLSRDVQTIQIIFKYE